MHVLIKILGKYEFKLDVENPETITSLEFKKIIEREIKIPVSEQSILAWGVNWENNTSYAELRLINPKLPVDMSGMKFLLCPKQTTEYLLKQTHRKSLTLWKKVDDDTRASSPETKSTCLNCLIS